MKNTNITEATRNATLIAGEINIVNTNEWADQLYKTHDGKYFEINYNPLFAPTADYITEWEAKKWYNQACKFGKQCVSYEEAFA